MKKIVILKDNGGRLANQLWNFSAIYSYCLERKYDCHNYAFFRYQKYFNIYPGNFVYELFFRFHAWHKNYKFSRVLNYLYYRMVKLIHNKYIITDCGMDFNLPPTENSNSEQTELIYFVTNSSQKSFYFVGWLFRNPTGLNFYHEEIRKYFRPKEVYYTEVVEFKNKLKERYKLIVGVHIRQSDYKTWQGGKFYFSSLEVSKILRDYVQQQKEYSRQDIIFVICSDGEISLDDFDGLNLVMGPGHEITDLYVLAESDVVIGSNSTYGMWAAYYGQVPFYSFSREKIDWNVKFIPS